MASLRTGQEVVLSWPFGTLGCRVIAAAGRFVLLKPEHDDPFSSRPSGPCSLTFLDGVIPMGYDGIVETGAQPGEFRFRLADQETGGERRATARVPADGPVTVTRQDGTVLEGRLLDLSAGGARFRHMARLGDRGALVRFHTEVAGGLAVEADAVLCAAEVGISSVRFETHHAANAQDIGAWTINQLRRSLAA